MVRNIEKLSKEHTLDPENWDSLIALGHNMLDDMMNFLKNIRKHKIVPISEEVIAKIRQPVPLKSQGYEETYKEFLEHVFPYPVPGMHPHFWGFVMGTGSPLGVLSEMLAACMNSNGPNYFAPFHIENQFIEWLKEILDYPQNASGVLVSGGSMANFTGLAVARNAKAQVDIKKQGVQDIQNKMVLYTSKEGHKCLTRAIELLDEAAHAAEKNLKILYNSQRCPIPGAIKTKGGIPWIKLKRIDLMNFISVTCGCSNSRAKVKKPLMPMLGLCAESVNILIVAPIN